MTIIRFLGFVLGWLLAPLALIALIPAYIILSIILATRHTWLRAKRDPRYDEFWYI